MTTGTTEPDSGTGGPAVVGRLKIVLWSVLVSAVALGVTLLAVRSVLLVQVDRQADATISDEVQAFITFVEGAPYIGNGEPEQFASEAELMRSFLARQTPESHEALVTVSDGDVMFLDNAQHDAGRRFAESEDTLETVLMAQTSSGVLQTDAFGEVRWGRVTTDQDGAFIVLHFATPAEADVQATMNIVAWIGAASLLLVAVLSWLASRWLGSHWVGSHWVGSRRPRARQASAPAPAAPTPTATTPADAAPSDAAGFDPASAGPAGRESWPTAPVPTPHLNMTSIHPRRSTVAQVLLAVQREAAAAHPGRRFVLASGPGDQPAESAAERSTSAEALGALAQIEAEVDVDAVRDGLLALIDHSLGTDPGNEAGDVVVLGGHTVTSPDGTLLRLSIRGERPLPDEPAPHKTPDPETAVPATVHADTAATSRPDHHGISSAEAPPLSPAEASGRWRMAEQIAAAHHGRCWRVSGPGSPPEAGMDLPMGPAASSPDTAVLPVPPLGVGS